MHSPYSELGLALLATSEDVQILDMSRDSLEKIDRLIHSANAYTTNFNVITYLEFIAALQVVLHNTVSPETLPKMTLTGELM